MTRNTPFEVHCEVHRGTAGQDRAVALPVGARYLLVLSDGAGGISGGAEAAQAIIDFFRDHTVPLAAPDDPATLTMALGELDGKLSSSATGEATAVVAVVDEKSVWGASVGDSGAWLVSPAMVNDLTENQRRKPLLGSGESLPVPFGPTPFVGKLLVASDGLLKYAARETIRAIITARALGDAPKSLVESVRLRSGGFQDDVALILCGRSVV